MLRFSRYYWPASLTDPQERVSFLILAGAVSLALVSVAASQILLASAVAAALWLWKQHGRSIPSRLPFALPLLIFCIWTLLTIVLAPDVRFAFLETKKFFIYAILFLVPMLVRGKGTAIWIYHATFAVAALACFKGIAQFISNPHRGLLERISGFMSQWMTYSGLLMLVLVVVSAFFFALGWRKHWWIVPMGLLVALPLYLSETRSAQLGAVAGMLVVLLLLRKLRALLVLLVLILGVYIASPSSIKHRLQSGFDTNDPNTRNRIELFGTAGRLIRDNPWVGVGPKNVAREALRYRGSREWPDWMYQHMHNNFLQIAAERGIPGLIFWLLLMGRLAWDSFRVYYSARTHSDSPEKGDALLISTAALGGWVALMVAGMFEYNFGDSEVLTLFLFMMSAPYSFLPELRPQAVERAEVNSARAGSPQ